MSVSITARSAELRDEAAQANLCDSIERDGEIAEAGEACILVVGNKGRIVASSGAARRLIGQGDLHGRSAYRIARRLGLSAAALRHMARVSDAETRCRLSLKGRLRDIRVTRLIGGDVVVMIQDGSEAQVRVSNRDALTELPDRQGFSLRLDEAMARMTRTGEGFALLAIDLDRFKAVNDTLGHPVGDALLGKVAERLRSALRPTDCAARLGGDEFIVLQSGVDKAEAAEVLAHRLVDLLGRAYVIDGHLINIGASLGVALAPLDGNDAHTLVKHADQALYRAKGDGRGTFRFFKPEMDARMQARRLLELDLRKALALRQFELHYQPQLNLDTNTLVGCEALIRWRHPERGTVSPLDFIPLAEETGLIVPIGEWVIRTACREAVRWPSHVSVAVNLSPAQFRSKKLVETVVSALASAGLAPQRLELEITEGLLLEDNASNLAALHALRALGLRISMDDFGTGYSSLSYLRSFPFDKIKIDRSFVTDLDARPDRDAIIRAIASLGTSFGMTTVAEGVETHDQMQRIRAGGCTDVQGYLVSRPVPADAILELLARGASAPGFDR